MMKRKLVTLFGGTVLAGSLALMATSVNAWWGGWGDRYYGPWGGGPWYGGYPYYGGYGYPYGGYGYPYGGWGYPYGGYGYPYGGWGYPYGGYAYPAYGYPYAAPVVAAPAAPTTESSNK